MSRLSTRCHIVYRDLIDGLKANDEVKRRYLAV